MIRCTGAAFPNNRRIRQLAKELREMEHMPLTDFLTSYIRQKPSQRVTAMQAIAEQQLMWVCACGKRQFNHYENCPACGKERPLPPEEAEPSDITRPDPGVT